MINSFILKSRDGTFSPSTNSLENKKGNGFCLTLFLQLFLLDYFSIPAISLINICWFRLLGFLDQMCGRMPGAYLICLTNVSSPPPGFLSSIVGGVFFERVVHRVDFKGG